ETSCHQATCRRCVALWSLSFCESATLPPTRSCRVATSCQLVATGLLHHPRLTKGPSDGHPIPRSTAPLATSLLSAFFLDPSERSRLQERGARAPRRGHLVPLHFAVFLERFPP